MLFLGPDVCWTWSVCFVFADSCVVVLGNVVACVVLLVIFRFVRYHMVMVPLVVFTLCGFVLLSVVFLFSLTWLPGVVIVGCLPGRVVLVLFLMLGGCVVGLVVFGLLVIDVTFL